MCGIAGRFSAHHLSEDADWAGHASRLLAHRGPNGSGHLVDEYCELVHRRLSIIDLSDNGKQPMANEDESIHVIFNGEIYNYKKLREELKAKGHRFKSQTDTEVLVHLYEEYQEDMVNLIEGMFAFAIYDKPKKQLLLARDRFGIKPLYYATLGNQCVFGSEIKAILALKSLSPTLNHQACYDYLQLGYIPEPTTGFLEINALPKGHLLVVNKNKSSLTKYYQIKVSVNPLYDMSQSVDVGASLLSEAVENQAFADVTVGALLSGGIDSSLVVSAYARSQRKKPLTFSIGFSDKNYDETSIANQVSRHLNTQHHVTHIENNTISLDNILKLFLHLDQPFADTSMIPMNYAAQAIRNHGIKCAFSGDGGDEVFGGYARFWRANYFYTIASLPAYCQGLLKYIAAVVIRCNPDLGRQMTKAIRLAQRGHKDTAYLLAGLSSWINQEQAEQLLENNNSNKYLSVQRHFETRTQDGKNNLEKLSSAMTENLFDIGLPSDMLRKVDMMSMLEGVEIRVPMLSENLVSFGLTLNHQMKTDGKKGKMVLRQIAKRQLPEAVAAHKKHGFSIPMDVVFDKSIHQKLNDLLLSKDSRTSDFLNRDIVKKWISLFKQSKTRANHEEIGRAGLYQRIFIAMALELWLREHRLTW